MIIKIGRRGADPGGLVRYLADVQDSSHKLGRNQHTNPHVVAGSLGYDGAMDPAMVATLSAELRTPTLKFPDAFPDGNQIWHAAISLRPEEGKLDSETWGKIAQDFMSEMGLQGGGKAPLRWVAVNHGVNASGSDHIHIAANLIREDGTKANVYRDMPRAQKAAMVLEERYGLDVLASRHANVSSRGFGKDDHGHAKNSGVEEPRRTELERRVRAAAAGATSEDQFVQNLGKQGLQFRGRRDQNGKVIGYAVNLPATTTASGKEHWWAGGKLARDLSLPRLRQGWASPTGSTPTTVSAIAELQDIRDKIPTASGDQLAEYSHQVAGALAAASQATEQTPGPLAMASKRVGTYAQTRTYKWKPRPPALGIGLLFLQAVDPAGPVGKAVLLKQLLATMDALLDANRARSMKMRRPSMAGEATAEDEVIETMMTVGVTAGLRAMENNARAKEAVARNEQDLPEERAKDHVLGKPIPAQGITERQAQVLLDRGLDPAEVSTLNKREASLLISRQVRTIPDAREKALATAVLLAPEGGPVSENKANGQKNLTPAAPVQKNTPPAKGRSL